MKHIAFRLLVTDLAHMKQFNMCTKRGSVRVIFTSYDSMRTSKLTDCKPIYMFLFFILFLLSGSGKALFYIL